MSLPLVLPHVRTHNARTWTVHPSGSGRAEVFTRHINPRRGVKFPPVIQEFLGNNNIKRRYKMARKRRSTRRKRGYLRRRRVPRTLAPPRQLVKLKLTQGVALNPGAAGAIATTNFIINDIADPEGASGVQQPLGYDQWSTLYQRFCVIGAKAYLIMHNEDTSYAQVYGMHATTEANALTSYEHYRELPNTRMKLLTPDVDHSGVVGKYSIKKLTGVKKLLHETDLNGTTSSYAGGGQASPDRKVYLQLFAQPLQGQDSGVMRGYITIEYLVVFYDPVIPSRSTN